MNVFFFILTNNIVPIFALIILGFALSKKFDLDIMTLTKLNFYVFVPAFTFVNLYTAQIPMEMIKVLIAACLILITNMVLVGIMAKFRGYDEGLKNAFTNSVIFYNAGNIGIPLITLAFTGTPYLEIALTAQIMVMLVQTLTTSTLGFINAGRGANTHWKESVVKVLKMPTIYMIPLAFILKSFSYDFTQFALWPALEYARAAVIPLSLITLGVQLSKTQFEFKNKEVYISVLMRLVGGPIIALLFIYVLRIEGVIAQVVLISTAVPTAVNAALIAVECNNYPDFSSQTVMISTLLGSVSLVFVIYMAEILFPIL
ncbi:AEC family transporter [Alkalicella caledoniensis]|uniref:AEC family transporter n=1 Tax=Alkalicella caledoniensis TaxID=2731377 RepID=A0A7G9W5M7_ALKCA|nr:AEC family transporter [Alkalicella caledoniensis]QNO13989.1 AEC family transporter [Alkalicella caledoniensis]